MGALAAMTLVGGLCIAIAVSKARSPANFSLPCQSSILARAALSRPPTHSSYRDHALASECRYRSRLLLCRTPSQHPPTGPLRLRPVVPLRTGSLSASGSCHAWYNSINRDSPFLSPPQCLRVNPPTGRPSSCCPSPATPCTTPTSRRICRRQRVEATHYRGRAR